MIGLGIDIGTTKVAVVIFDISTNTLLAQESRVFGGLASRTDGHHEEAVENILHNLDSCFQNFDQELLDAVDSIGVTGQMHGIVFRNSKKGHVSNLVTWQDQRCLEDNFIEQIREQTGETNIHTGYGFATMAWYNRNKPAFLQQFDQAGTIQDLVVAYLCESEQILMDYSNAASWGFFNVSAGQWKLEALQRLEVPLQLIPRCLPCGGLAGLLGKSYARRWKLRAGLPVMTAIGDNQASLFCTIKDPQNELSLTLGTSGQLSAIIEEFPKGIEQSAEWSKVEIRPFVKGQYAVVAASLCGGSALGWLTNVISDWMRDLGVENLSKDSIYLRLNELSKEAGRDNKLKIAPHFLGERFDPSLKASIAGVDFSNFNIGQVFYALAEGVVCNLKSMQPKSVLDSKKLIVGSGNGLRRFVVFTEIIGREFNMPLTLLPEREEAACGAAMLSAEVE